MSTAATMEKSHTSIRILIVDDHPVVLEGLRLLFEVEGDMCVVAEADEAASAVAAFRSHRPDVAVMDLRLRTTSGIEATQNIRAEFPDSRVIVLTNYDRVEDVHKALQAGAQGYLLKDSSGSEIVDAVRIVHAGRRYIPRRIEARLNDYSSGLALTAREHEVLRLMAAGKRNRAIAKLLDIAEETVKGHVKNILSKLGVQDRTEAATTAIHRGLID